MKYYLKDQNTSVRIDTKGAELQSFNINGIEYMHQANPMYWNRTAPYLFPNIGTIQDKYATVDGVKYPFGKHGFLRDTEMTCIKESEKQLIFELVSNEETLAKYPFKFRLSINYMLENNLLTTRVMIENKDNKPMPFNFGLHPAFKVPQIEGEAYEDYKIVFNNPVNCTMPYIDLVKGLIDWNKESLTFDNVKEFNLNHDDFKNDAFIIEPYPQGPIQIVSPSGKVVEITTYGFKTLGIWSTHPTKSPFVCIEPWIGCADKPGDDHEFSHKKDIITLQPNEIWTTTYTIEIK